MKLFTRKGMKGQEKKIPLFLADLSGQKERKREEPRGVRGNLWLATGLRDRGSENGSDRVQTPREHSRPLPSTQT
jgi:hypothetical protein